jgi:hypothetical protein
VAADDDTGCEHMWRLAVVTLDHGGGHAEYVCELTGCVLLVPPGGVHPETV